MTERHGRESDGEIQKSPKVWGHIKNLTFLKPVNNQKVLGFWEVVNKLILWHKMNKIPSDVCDNTILTVNIDINK